MKNGKTRNETVLPQGGTPPAGDSGSRAPQGEAGRHERNQKILIVLGASLLCLAIIASAFALGYCIGTQNSNTRARSPWGGSTGTNESQGQTGPGGQDQQDGGVRRPGTQRLRELVQSGELKPVRGSVTSVENNNVKVQTPQGTETVTLTQTTRYPGAGKQGATGGNAVQLSPGDKVLILARKGAGGNLEAAAVRVQGQGQSPQQAPQPQQAPRGGPAGPPTG